MRIELQYPGEESDPPQWTMQGNLSSSMIRSALESLKDSSNSGCALRVFGEMEPYEGYQGCVTFHGDVIPEVGAPESLFEVIRQELATLTGSRT